MRNKRITYRMLLLLSAVLLAGCGRKAVVTGINVVPEPVFLVQKEGSYTLHSNPKLSVVGLGQNSATVKYAMKSLRHAHLHPKLVAASQNSDIEFVLYDTVNPELGDEGYLLEVRSTGITMSANTEKGIFYAYQTLVQMLPPDVTSVSYSSIMLPECTILDYPRFSWRGCHLDVSRHFFPVKFVKKYLDVMAAYKMNKFHFHLTDDHGWRLPSERYPRLNSVGSWRVDRNDQPWGKADPPRDGERASYGGFYSREELLDIVQYAADRGIEVIPEVDIPGHASAILASYPGLACDNYPYRVAIGPYWPPKAILCAGNDSTLVVLKAIMDELCEIFPSKYIHIGGDEAFKDNWRQCPKCQQRIRQEHLSGEEQLQSWLVGQLQQYLATKGRTIIGWDEIMGLKDGSVWSLENSTYDNNPFLAPDAVIMSWRGLKPGMDAARAGRKVIMCPTEYCYLDYYQADARYQPAAIGGMTTLQKAYDFDPAPMGTNLHVEANILGGQCNLWTEFINTPQHAEYMLLPRMLAISESLWSPRDKKDWNRFRRKVEDQKDWLGIKGYNYCEGSFTPQFTAHRIDDNTTNIAISTEVPNTYVFYTTDLSTPTRESAIYLGPINLKRGTHIKLLPVYKDIERDSVYEFVIK
ncbi:MAG: family 20 glycosylhydrolase [Bacteroidales bacterium]|nr:family 20 glycosylhydrolase [Bacteroidales bacterium]